VRVSFATLWVYCIGWFAGDALGRFTGWWTGNFEDAFTVAYFILMAWIFERLSAASHRALSPADGGMEERT
jgi:hypothetical protein